MVLLFPNHDSVLDEVKIAAKIEAGVEIHGTQDGTNTCTDGFDKSIYRERVTQKGEGVLSTVLQPSFFYLLTWYE
jgi:hypothetical protein